MPLSVTSDLTGLPKDAQSILNLAAKSKNACSFAVLPTGVVGRLRSRAALKNLSLQAGVKDAA